VGTDAGFFADARLREERRFVCGGVLAASFFGVVSESIDARSSTPRRAILRAMLEPIADSVWTTERPQRFFGVECGTRTTLVRLRAGGLFVHCPAALDETMRADLASQKEPVRAVVAPSSFHHLYIRQWMDAFPDALFACCPKLVTKRPDLKFGHVLGDAPHPIWAEDLDQVYFSARLEDEVVFLHRATHTMITADALLNLWGHPSLLTRGAALFMLNTAPGKGWMERIMVWDWKKGRREVDRILKWDIDRIVLAHGKLVREHGHDAVRDAYRWL
jgi:hypothetical protein